MGNAVPKMLSCATSDIAREQPVKADPEYLSGELRRPDWLTEFERALGRPLRVLHVGNIANNAYINAILMRKIGIHADIVCADYYHIMGTPEWESGKLEGDYGDAFFPDWWRSMPNYKRPTWFFQGPKRLCQETLRAQFETPELFAKQAATLRIAMDYVAFRDSKLARPEGCPSRLGRLRRQFDFFLYLLKTAVTHPSVGWNAIVEMFPALSILATIAQMLIFSVALVFTLVAKIVNRIVNWVSGRNSNFGISLSIELATLRWRLQNRLRTSSLIPMGSRAFFAITGRHFSEVTGFSASDWLAGITPFKLRNVNVAQSSSDSAPVPSVVRVSERDRERYIAETIKYLEKIRSHVGWGTVHRQCHRDLDDKQYAEDIALATALTEGWEEVFAHYDVVQCYSTDGIAPMALGRKSYFSYEHGTLRSIPFEPTQIGRLTATAYRLSSKVMLTNLDNYVSCDRLEIPSSRIVPLPHALDDSKIHRFVTARPHLKPAASEAPLFFSSSRQHWLDRDPNYAKGNDVFFRAAARVRDAGYPIRIMLVEWGRDLAATKDLLSDLKLSGAVTWVPTMTGEELWERYLQCDAVVDQFVIPAFGRVTFDSLTIGRRVISNLDVALAKRFFGQPPPMLVASTIEEAEQAVLTVAKDPKDRAGVGTASAAWARKYHSSQTILDLQLEAYRPSLAAVH